METVAEGIAVVEIEPVVIEVVAEDLGVGIVGDVGDLEVDFQKM